MDSDATDFAICSNSQEIDNNRFTSKMENKLKRELPKLPRCILLAKQQVTCLHEKVINQCTDLLNKLSTKIIKSYDAICIEDLTIKILLRNHKSVGKIKIMLRLSGRICQLIKTSLYLRKGC